jgi:hypothetical protein
MAADVKASPTHSDVLPERLAVPTTRPWITSQRKRSPNSETGLAPISVSAAWPFLTGTRRSHGLDGSQHHERAEGSRLPS